MLSGLGLTASGAEKRRTRIELASTPWKGVALPLSYHRAHKTSTTGGSATVTVCTNHLALVDLAKHSLPIPAPHPGGDSEFLTDQVIELQDYRVCLPAVDAGMLAEKCNEEPHPLCDESLFPTPRCGDVPLTVGEIVLAFVSGSARAAIGVALRQRPSTPSKRTRGLDLAASTAPMVEA
jgi:hypothetical protein